MHLAHNCQNIEIILVLPVLLWHDAATAFRRKMRFAIFVSFPGPTTGWSQPGHARAGSERPTVLQHSLRSATAQKTVHYACRHGRCDQPGHGACAGCGRHPPAACAALSDGRFKVCIGRSRRNDCLSDAGMLVATSLDMQHAPAAAETRPRHSLKWKLNQKVFQRSQSMLICRHCRRNQSRHAHGNKTCQLQGCSPPPAWTWSTRRRRPTPTRGIGVFLFSFTINDCEL